MTAYTPPMNFTSVCTALTALFQTVADQTLSTGGKRFGAVQQGMPHALPAVDRVIAYWVDSDETEEESYGNVMRDWVFHIGLYWFPRTANSTVQALESELMESFQAVVTALRGSSKLGGLCDDLKVRPFQRQESQFQDTTTWYTSLDFDIAISDPEAEAIVP